MTDSERLEIAAAFQGKNVLIETQDYEWRARFERCSVEGIWLKEEDRTVYLPWSNVLAITEPPPLEGKS